VLALALATLPGAAPVAAADAGVVIRNTGTFAWAYMPGTVRIGVGDSVTWTDQSDAGSEPHTATPDSGGFAGSAILRPGDSYTATFAAAGRFTYHCDIHPAMTGVVIVSAAATPAQTPPATTRPTAAPTQRATPTAPATTAVPTPTPSPSATRTPPPSATTPGPNATATPTASPSLTATAIPTASPSSSAGPSPTPTSGTDTSSLLVIVLAVAAAAAVGGLLRLAYRRGR
jgi:plastocyanin